MLPAGHREQRLQALLINRPRWDRASHTQDKTIMKKKSAFILLMLSLASMMFAAGQASAQERRGRTIDEVTTEAVHRAEVGQYPLIGLDPADAKEAFEGIHPADKDEWAPGF